MKRWLALTVVAAAIGAAVYAIPRWRREEAGNLPTAPARKGDFLVLVRCRGELIARRSVQLVAPRNVPELKIVWLAAAGERVKEGEPVIRFDPSSAKRQLDEKAAALNQAEATLEQAVAQARITAEQDRLDLAEARYTVERAKLEASKAEIVSALQGEESRINLGLAEQKLRVQEAAVKLHEASDRAKIASLTRVRDAAKAEVDITKRRIEQMEISAPISGVIVYMPNFSQGWMNAKPFKVGDNAWPGASLAEIPDLQSLEMEGKLEEIDRGRVAVGNDVRVKVDGLPEKTLPGKLARISPLTQQSFEWPPVRTFRGYAKMDEIDQRLRPAMNGSVDVIVKRIPGAISVPAKAVFTRAGKPVVYVLSRTGYHAVEVKVEARNPDEVAVSGIAAGTMVTLVEPDKQEGKV